MKLNLLKNSKKDVKKKPTPSKKSTTKQQFEYSYAIIPTNFVNLSPENQMKKLGQFFDVLRVIENRIKITISKKMTWNLAKRYQLQLMRSKRCWKRGRQG